MDRPKAKLATSIYDAKAVAMWCVMYASALTGGVGTMPTAVKIWDFLAGTHTNQPLSQMVSAPIATGSLALSVATGVALYWHYRPTKPPEGFGVTETTSQKIFSTGGMAAVTGFFVYDLINAAQKGFGNHLADGLWGSALTLVSIWGASAIAKRVHSENKAPTLSPQ